ncbi:MAG TPA: hypothetical protein VHO48_05095 [Anaerolineaceae bacterium]|nr:hypothetical protein [Anaerolineaceae bacterium]
MKRQPQRGADQPVPGGGAAVKASWKDLTLPITLLTAALLLWLFSLPFVHMENINDLGLVSVLPITFWFGLLILLVSFVLLVFRHANRTGLLLLHSTLLILIIHGTPALVYGTLRYSWAWKHVGMVDYIMRNGSVNPTISYLDAYHNWPGFFALNAFITQVAGLDSAVGYARWAPVFFNLLFLGALFLIYHAITWDKRLVWMSIWIFFLANWVGQDYFSPQALTYFFYLAMLGIFLRWFQPLAQGVTLNIGRRLTPSSIAGRAQNFLHRASADVFILPSTPGQRVALLVVITLLMISMVFSHQLTPIMALSALLALVIFRRLYPGAAVVLLAALTMSWIWFVATPFVVENLRSLIVSVGTLQSNLTSSFINLQQASPGQVTVAVMGRLLTISVAILGIAGYIMRRRHGHLDLTPLLLALAPLPILAINSYGGEVLFRVFLFSLPFFAFFIAALFFPDAQVQRGSIAPVAATLLTVAMLISFSFAYYGKEKQYYFSRDEVAASEYLFDIAPPGSMIIEGTRNYPTVYKNYEQYRFVTISREPPEALQNMLANPVDTLARWMSDPKYPNTFLILTRSQKAEVDAVGTMPAGSLARIEEAVRLSGQFEVVYFNGDATIYIYRGGE